MLYKLLLSFAVGFALATIIGLTVVIPQAHKAWQVNIDSDVHRPLEGALQYVENSAKRGDINAAHAQVRLLNKHFAAYRAGGPLPSDWWHEVEAAATKPASEKNP
jgi:hypothetical protein